MGRQGGRRTQRRCVRSLPLCATLASAAGASGGRPASDGCMHCWHVECRSLPRRWCSGLLWAIGSLIVLAIITVVPYGAPPLQHACGVATRSTRTAMPARITTPPAPNTPPSHTWPCHTDSLLACLPAAPCLCSDGRIRGVRRAGGLLGPGPRGLAAETGHQELHPVHRHPGQLQPAGQHAGDQQDAGAVRLQREERGQQEEEGERK